MDTVFEGVLVVLAVVLLVATWALICNSRTLKERLAIISQWKTTDNFWRAEAEFSAVSYEAHMWRLMTFRDPRPLYGPLTQTIFSKAA